MPEPSTSPFSNPLMRCRYCGKPSKGHGPYCRPIIGRLIVALGALALALCGVLWFLWMTDA